MTYLLRPTTNMLVTILFTTIFLSGCICYENYYWREYFGVIPEDAVVAGKDIADRKVYIVQAYIKGYGLVVAQVTAPGGREVVAASDGPHSTNKYIKILCGDPQNFEWLQTTTNTFENDTAGKHLVLGGHQHEKGFMHVGRISVAGDTKVGKINPFVKDEAAFYFIEDGQEKKLKSFEILWSKEPSEDPFNLS